MDSKYDKIRKLFSEEQSPLPPELDWDQMQAGIFEKMEDIEASQKQRPSYLSARKIGIVLGMLCLLLLLQWICTPRGGTQVSHDQPSGTSKDFTSGILNAPKGGAEKGALQGNVYSTTKQPSVAPFGSTPLSTPENSDLQVSSQPLSENIQVETNTNGETALTKTNGQLPMVSSPVGEAVTNVQTENVSTTNEKEEAPITVPEGNNRLSSSLPGIPSKQILVESPLRAIVSEKVSAPIIAAPVLQKEQALKSGQFSMLGGASLWSFGYGGSHPERAEFEQTMPSFNAQFNYIQPLKKGYSLLIGFQFQQLESRLEYQTTLEDYRIVLEDTIVQIQNNLVSGQQNVVRGDVELFVNAERRIRHYNRIQLYQIPIAIGKSWMHKNWQADIFLGGNLNLISRYSGRTIYNGAIQDYNGAATDFLSSQWKVNAWMAGRLTYLLTDQLGITAGMEFQRSLMNWSKASDSRMNPTIIGLGAGLSYRW